MNGFDSALAAAFQAHQTGNLDAAERGYRQTLAAQPQLAAARHLLGVLLHQRKHYAEAVDELRQATSLESNNSTFQNHLGAALGELGELGAAERAFREAVRLAPHDAQIRFNLGALLYRRDKREESIAAYDEAIRLHPQYPEAHYNLANAARDLKRLDLAVWHYRQALRFKPGYLKAMLNLAAVLQEQVNLTEAEALYREAIELAPEQAETHHKLGLVLQAQRRNLEAAASFVKTLSLNPNHAEAHNNLGCVRLELGEFDEAVKSCQQAIALKPDFTQAYNNLGSMQHEKGNDDVALKLYDQALELEPNFAEALYNRSLISLARGNFPTAWTEYEWRLKSPDKARRPMDKPQWDGEPLGERTLLVQAEQGLGDTLQFVRYLPLVRARVERVIVEVQKPLLPLLRASGCESLYELHGPLPAFDAYVPFLSLPHLFETTLKTIPTDVPYLRAEPMLVEKWRLKLASVEGLKIGIAWQGNPSYRSDRLRSVSLVEFAPIAQVPGVRLISLQRHVGLDQLNAIRDRFDVMTFGDDFDAASGPFMDTAAVMSNLDLVITSDSAVAHLAGGLGVPVWLALPIVCDWRWMHDRDDTPWYPTMRLFRQSATGDWKSVFERMAERLSSSDFSKE